MGGVPHHTNLSATVYLLRHAESRPDATVRESDWPLSERGHQQAIDIVPLLTTLGIDQVYSILTSEPLTR